MNIIVVDKEEQAATLVGDIGSALVPRAQPRECGIRDLVRAALGDTVASLFFAGPTEFRVVVVEPLMEVDLRSERGGTRESSSHKARVLQHLRQHDVLVSNPFVVPGYPVRMGLSAGQHRRV